MDWSGALPVGSTSLPHGRRHGYATWLAIPLALGLLTLTFWFVTQAGSTVVTETRSLAPFGAVELAGAGIVTIDVGARQSVTVKAREDMLSHVTTQVQNGTLIVATPPNPQPTKGPMSVSVSVPSLRSLTLSPTGSGAINVTGIDAPNLTVTLAGSGAVYASGRATRLDVSVPGSGNADLGASGRPRRARGDERIGPDLRHCDRQSRRVDARHGADPVRR